MKTPNHWPSVRISYIVIGFPPKGLVSWQSEKSFPWNFTTTHGRYTYLEMRHCSYYVVSSLLPHAKNVVQYRERAVWRRCSTNIFILALTPGFNGLGKDICSKTSLAHEAEINTTSSTTITFVYVSDKTVVLQCGAVITRSIFFNILTIDTPGITYGGKQECLGLAYNTCCQVIHAAYI